MEEATVLEVVLVGGHVVDPASGFDAPADVAVGGGGVLAVGPGLWVDDGPAGAAAGLTTPPGGPEVIDVAGLLVTPGLIDLHVHVFPGLGNFCVDPDEAGVDRLVVSGNIAMCDR